MKTALITGANRGIGYEIARQLAELNFYVILTGRDLVKAHQAATTIPGSVRACGCDVSDPLDCQRLYTELQPELTHLDVLVNNAGIMGNSATLDFNLDQMQRVMNTNLMGAINVTAALWPLIVKSPDARIINMSSGMAETRDMQQGYHAPYRLSKWGLNGWTMLLAAEAPKNVSVNAMCPGWVRTDMGGASAPRPREKGAETAVWLATDPNVPHGKFLRDKKVIDW